jgi:hypothetical protein
MPYVTEVPERIEIDHLETPSPLNPLGIKGAGEAGCIPVSAVIASAIEDAEGFPITRMPISPNDLWELRRRHEAGNLPSLRRAGTAHSSETEPAGTAHSSETDTTTQEPSA